MKKNGRYYILAPMEGGPPAELEVSRKEHERIEKIRKKKKDRKGWNAFGTSYIGGSGNPFDS